MSRLTQLFSIYMYYFQSSNWLNHMIQHRFMFWIKMSCDTRASERTDHFEIKRSLRCQILVTHGPFRVWWYPSMGIAQSVYSLLQCLMHIELPTLTSSGYFRHLGGRTCECSFQSKSHKFDHFWTVFEIHKYYNIFCYLSDILVSKHIKYFSRKSRFTRAKKSRKYFVYGRH